ncbi:MAG TPA: DUF1440 domain-containing protein [Gemmatimonadales bacterium]|nr:DUF1440 domain-containing protein [Gemmatimonadales bacterium]
MSRSARRHTVGEDLVKGAIAGAVATYVMGRITTLLYDREDRHARKREDDARGGGTAYGAAAEKGAELLGRRLSKEEQEQAGSAIHWALGMGAGAAYAVARRRLAFLGSTVGTAFGTAFWGFVDEGLVPALGLTPGPLAFPWQAHARGFVGHLTFGTVTDGTLRVLDRVF